MSNARPARCPAPSCATRSCSTTRTRSSPGWAMRSASHGRGGPPTPTSRSRSTSACRRPCGTRSTRTPDCSRAPDSRAGYGRASRSSIAGRGVTCAGPIRPPSTRYGARSRRRRRRSVEPLPRVARRPGSATPRRLPSQNATQRSQSATQRSQSATQRSQSATQRSQSATQRSQSATQRSQNVTQRSQSATQRSQSATQRS